MAFFGVTLEIIEKILPHPNADKLELGVLHDMTFQFVVPKGIYKPGDRVLYFPLDSVIGNETLEKMGLIGKLSGSQHNRVKTIKLRGEISQGLIGSVDLVSNEIIQQGTEAITTFLGVTKYDPDIFIPGTKGIRPDNLLPLPEGLSAYDIEGIDRNKRIANLLLSQPIEITEKIEGTNFSITLDQLGNLFVNQRNFSIKQDDNNVYWNTAKKLNLHTKIFDIANEFLANNITIYGELVGPSIQKNYYNLSDYKIFVFDIKINNKWINTHSLHNICLSYGICEVPVLFKGNLNLTPEQLKEYSNGKSVLIDKLREGIVIKPLIEDDLIGFGRLILKQRSPEYLAKE